ncbi:hypothetical protein HZS_3687 [Henneguya salminicola]|nr:hypothetical protein HZS_3687 [Henneguya salminicola]
MVKNPLQVKLYLCYPDKGYIKPKGGHLTRASFRNKNKKKAMPKKNRRSSKRDRISLEHYFDEVPKEGATRNSEKSGSFYSLSIYPRC